jgi:ornithine cyclodeaminase
LPTALREAGDVIGPVRAGRLDPAALSDIADLVRGKVDITPGRPRLFKSVGMAWEDLVVAATTYETSGEARDDRG